MMKVIVTAIVFLSLTMMSTVAIATTANSGHLAPHDGPLGVDSVTTGAASRARADVQIRRIKKLIVSRPAWNDRDFDELQRLERELSGAR